MAVTEPLQGAPRERTSSLHTACMSQASFQVVRRFYEAWSQDRFPGPVQLMDAEIEYVNPPDAVEPGTRRGIAAFTETTEKLLESWEYWRAEVEDWKVTGDDVAVIVSYRARGRGSGVGVEGREVWPAS